MENIRTIYLDSGDACRMLSNIMVAFNYTCKTVMRKMITMMRFEIEYCEVVLTLQKKKHLRKSERIQKIHLN